jgi:hypothetical protein
MMGPCVGRGRWLAAGGVLALAVFATQLKAQLPNPSAAALGLGENHIALARGYSAMSTNPAGLAIPGSPGSSFALLSVRGVGGLGPVDLGDFRDFEGETLPEAVRRLWLEAIIAEGAEHGSAGAEVTFLAAHAGRFGVQLATTAQLAGEIGPGAAELILFGNAGLTGEPADYLFTGGALDLVVASTAAFSYGHPVLRTDTRAISVGATISYTVGHVMVTAQDAGTVLSSDPLSVTIDFPIAQSDTLPSLDRLNQGTGVGLHLGGLWREGPLVFGLSIRNLVNTFEWDETTMFYRPGQAVLTQNDRSTDFDPQSFEGAPPHLQERVRELRYAPMLGAGGAYEVSPDVMVVGEVRGRLGDGQPLTPAVHAGGGVEYRPLPWLPLRAGAALISDGFLLSGGLGVSLGVVRLDAAVATRKDEFGRGTVGMFTFSSEAVN